MSNHDEFDKKTGSLHDCAKYGIQKYWLSDFPYLYNDWYDWYDKGEPAKTISKIISQYSGKNRSQLKILDCSCGTGKTVFTETATSIQDAKIVLTFLFLKIFGNIICPNFEISFHH